MEEVIAKKNKAIMASYIVILVAGVIFSAFGVSAFIFASEKFIGVILLIVGLAFVACGVAWIVIIARLPKAYIVFRGNKLLFSNGMECFPDEVDYSSSSRWGIDGAIFDWGTLTVSVNHIEYKFKFVANLGNAAKRLETLKAIYTAQKQIAQRKEEENKDAVNGAE